MAYGGGGRRLMGPLLVVNAVVCLILIGLSGWSLNQYIDGHQNHPHLGGNPATIFVLVYALNAGMIGGCSVIVGHAHLRIWSNTSAATATATASAMLSWALTALAFGLVCKQISMGGHRGRRLQTLEAFIAISGVSELLYLLLLYAGSTSS